MNQTYDWFKQKVIEKRLQQGWKLVEDKKDVFEIHLEDKQFERFLFQKEWSNNVQKQLGEKAYVISILTSIGRTKYNVVQQIEKEYVQILIFEYLATGKWYTLREIFNEEGEELNRAAYEEEFQAIEHAFFTELIKQNEYRLAAVTGILEIENHKIEDLLST